MTFWPSAHGDKPPPLRHADALNEWPLMWSETFIRSKAKEGNSGKSLQRKKPIVVCKILKMPEIANGKIASVKHTLSFYKN